MARLPCIANFQMSAFSMISQMDTIIIDWHVITPIAVTADALCRRDEHDDFPRLRRRQRQPGSGHVPHLPHHHGDDAVVLISRSIGQSRWFSFSGLYGCYGLKGCRRQGPLRLVKVYSISLVLPRPGVPEHSLAGSASTVLDPL
jgi:hypothetical protein